MPIKLNKLQNLYMTMITHRIFTLVIKDYTIFIFKKSSEILSNIF